jgi:type I restriction enzyme S subunit
VLASLAGQHRIVAKFDELMAVCDQLEQCLKIESEHRARLLKAALAGTLEVSDREAA